MNDAAQLFADDPFLRREYEAYLAQSAEWKEANHGRYAVFRGGKLIGVFDDSSEAARCGHETPPGSRFLLHLVGNESDPVEALPGVFGG